MFGFKIPLFFYYYNQIVLGKCNEKFAVNIVGCNTQCMFLLNLLLLRSNKIEFKKKKSVRLLLELCLRAEYIFRFSRVLNTLTTVKQNNSIL